MSADHLDLTEAKKLESLRLYYLGKLTECWREEQFLLARVAARKNQRGRDTVQHPVAPVETLPTR